MKGWNLEFLFIEELGKRDLKGLFTSDFEIFFLLDSISRNMCKTRHVFRIFDFDVVWPKNEKNVCSPVSF